MLSYDVVDVFADHPFAGNQLAVVHGAEDLSAAQCLALAREFNYAETSFPSGADGDSYRTRIFTPSAEIRFAGHPTLGTAWLLRERGEVGAADLVQHCGVGPVDVVFGEDGLVELVAAPRDLAGPLDDALVADLLGDVGLAATDSAGKAWVAGAGLSFVHVPVRGEALSLARASQRPLTAYADGLDPGASLRDPVDALNVYAVDDSEGSGQGSNASRGDAMQRLAIRARVFVPGLSVPEDPATGSAAAGLGMALVARGVLPHGGRYEIRQGVEMGRPSRLHGSVEAASGAPTRCHVAGRVHHVASGRIEVPAG